MPLSTILKPAATFLIHQASELALKGAIGGINLLRRINANRDASSPSQPLTHKDVEHIQDQIRSATTGNTCIRCGARGGVQSKYLPKPAHAGHKQGKAMAKAIMDTQIWRRGGALLPITWRCAHCDEYVCFNCTLVIPDSKPIQFYEDTYCSVQCRDDHNPCPACKQPRICRLNAIAGVEDERLDEIWFCANPECPQVGKTPAELANT